MPQYNRRIQRKGGGPNWSWERAALGAGTWGAQGAAAAGPYGALLAIPGAVIGGLTGVDTSVDRAPYEEALRQYTDDVQYQARVSGDQMAADAGAAFARRGLNASELAAGVITANRGRIQRGANQMIAAKSAEQQFAIAQREAQREREDAALTQQFLGQAAGSLFDIAIDELKGTPKPEIGDMGTRITDEEFPDTPMGRAKRRAAERRGETPSPPRPHTKTIEPRKSSRPGAGRDAVPKNVPLKDPQKTVDRLRPIVPAPTTPRIDPSGSHALPERGVPGPAEPPLSPRPIEITPDIPRRSTNPTRPGAGGYPEPKTVQTQQLMSAVGEEDMSMLNIIFPDLEEILA